MTISASVVEFGILCYALHYMWRTSSWSHK